MSTRRWGAVVAVAVGFAATGCSSAPARLGDVMGRHDVGSASVAANDAMAQEILTFPTEQSLQRVSELESRLELGLATASGLEEQLGGAVATKAAFASLATQRYQGLQSLGDVQPSVSGVRRAVLDADSQVEPLVGGLMGLKLLGDTKESNDLAAGQSATVGVGGKVVGSTTVGHLSIDLNVPYDQDGLVMTTRITSELDLCPDANGEVSGVAHVEASAVKNGVGQRLTLDVKYQSTTDDAAATHADGGIRMQAAQFGNGTKQFVDVSGGIGVGHLTDQQVNRTGGHVTERTIADAASLAVTGGLLAWVFMDAQVTQAVESGRCVELKPTVSAGPSGLQPKAKVTITAAPRSRVDGSPVGGSVVATLTAGGASVAPQGSKQKADATFKYVAPDEKDKHGGFKRR